MLHTHLYKKKKMREGFNRILALIDLSSESLHTAEEAAKIGAKFSSEIYLLYVSSNHSLSGMLFPQSGSFKTPGDEKEYSRNNKYRLEKTKIDLENRFGVNIKTHMAKGYLRDIVNNFVNEFCIDLVVVNAKKKTGFRGFLFGSAAETIINVVDSEVLCVYPQSDCSQLKKIVLPVGKFIPKRKIRVAYELARKFAASIHLISLNNPAGKKATENTKALLDTFRYLKDITNIPVECKTVSGVTIAEASVNYARTIGADLILVNPGVESHWSDNLLNRWGNDIVSRSSIPVLSVQSILNKTKPVLYPL
jgi:nucleotide-binding universal stress UspA family protein